MSAPAVFVRRLGGVSGAVPIALDLWNAAGPIDGDRVVFFDRPIPFPDRHPQAFGLASGDGHQWTLVEPGVEETWRHKGQDRVRRRLFLLDTDAQRVVGAYYWLEDSDGAKASSPEG